MLANFAHATFRILFWTYPRGCWQYDIVCGVILAFIFLVPNTIFDGSLLHQEQKVAASVSEERVSISADDEIE